MHVFFEANNSCFTLLNARYVAYKLDSFQTLAFLRFDFNDVRAPHHPLIVSGKQARGRTKGGLSSFPSFSGFHPRSRGLPSLALSNRGPGFFNVPSRSCLRRIAIGLWSQSRQLLSVPRCFDTNYMKSDTGMGEEKVRGKENKVAPPHLFLFRALRRGETGETDVIINRLAQVRSFCTVMQTLSPFLLSSLFASLFALVRAFVMPIICDPGKGKTRDEFGQSLFLSRSEMIY